MVHGSLGGKQQRFGVVGIGRRGGHFGLQSVILQRGGDASPELPRRRFVLDGSTAIGFDAQDGQQLVWAFIDGEEVSTESVDLNVPQQVPCWIFDLRLTYGWKSKPENHPAPPIPWTT